MEKIKIMIAEDSQMFRDFLVNAIDTVSDKMTITGVATNGKALLDLFKKNKPDILLLDLCMPEMDGIDVLKIIYKNFPFVKTIILSNYYSEYFVVQVILNGGSAYITKNNPFSEVINGIQCVYRDGYYFNKIISRKILTELKEDKKITTLDYIKLTERELEVLKLICADMPFDEIANTLNVRITTVRFHKRNLLMKTESHTLVSLVKYAIRQGIINK